MMMEEMFSKDFQDEFNNSSFYAKPKTTQLHISFNGEPGIIIGNAVVANIEVANEKIPVYSYNSDIFVKYLNGKNVITGVLALRKTTVDKFITVVEDYSSKIISEGKLSQIKSEIFSLQQLLENGTLDEISSEYYKGKIENLMKKEHDYIEESSKLYDRDRLDKTYDLLYYKDIERTLNAKISIVYNDDFISDITETIEDVLFTSKRTEINIGKNDIIEVYQFIGNPSRNGG